jgi:hypothetical protein
MHAHFTARNALNVVCPAPSRSFEGFAWRRETRSPPHSPCARSQESLVERMSPKDNLELRSHPNPSDNTSMKHPESRLEQRKTSFNPKAAAFSPTTIAAQQAKEVTAQSILPTPSTSAVPRRKLSRLQGSTTEFRKGDSTTGLDNAMHRKYRTQTGLAPIAVRLEDLISRGANVKSLGKPVEGKLLRTGRKNPLTMS